MTSLSPGPGTVNLLQFSLGDRRLALPAGQVREITRAVAAVALPKAPPIVEGVINYRGSVVPVLDMRTRFGLRPVPIHPNQHFVVADAGPRLVALQVDRVTDLVTVSAAAIEAVSRSTPGALYVAGIAKLPDGLLVIHDLERFLALDEAAQLDTALSDAAGAGHAPASFGERR